MLRYIILGTAALLISGCDIIRCSNEDNIADQSCRADYSEGAVTIAELTKRAEDNRDLTVIYTTEDLEVNGKTINNVDLVVDFGSPNQLDNILNSDYSEDFQYRGSFNTNGEIFGNAEYQNEPLGRANGKFDQKGFFINCERDKCSFTASEK